MMGENVPQPGESDTTGSTDSDANTPVAAHQVTMLLEAASAGDAQASQKLLPLVYEQLRRLAQSHMRKEAAGQTLQPTALVHEAYLRLVGNTELRWQGRGHFFAAAALAMRRILVDRARARHADKRGGGRGRVELHDVASPSDASSTDLLALDEALKKLESEQPRKYQVVMLRYFAGLSIEETAAAIGVSSATVKTDWAVARVWLYRAMGGPEGGEGGAAAP